MSEQTTSMQNPLGAMYNQARPPKLAVLTKIDYHQANPANDLIEIITLDEPGAGGAHHAYMVYWPTPQGQISRVSIGFQNGPIKENGVNGITQEVLLAIVAHRLEKFQQGPYACEENALAHKAVLEALAILHKRTRDRQARGVEGTSTV